MQSLNIQTLLMQPRDTTRRRFARNTNLRQNTTGMEDGIHYQLVDPREYTKYRTISVEEAEEEMNISNQIKENMYTIQGKFKNGFSSKKNRIKSATWNKTMEEPIASDSIDNQTQKRSIVENNKSIQRSTISNHQFDDNLPIDESKNEVLVTAVNIMKDRYEKNLSTVEKLHQERSELEQRVQALESKLIETSHQQNFGDSAMGDQSYTPYEYNPMEGSATLALKQSSHEPRMVSKTTNRSMRSHSAPRSRSLTNQQDGTRARSSSATRSLSNSLQSDVDRYIQRRRESERRENREQLAKQKYELELKERVLKAGLYGKEFKGLTQSHDFAAMQREEREYKRQMQLLNERIEKESQRKNLLESNHQRSLQLKNQLSWGEIQQIEEQKRQDRISQRKKKLLTITNAAVSSVKSKTLYQSPARYQHTPGQRHAEDELYSTTSRATTKSMMNLSRDRSVSPIHRRASSSMRSSGLDRNDSHSLGSSTPNRSRTGRAYVYEGGRFVKDEPEAVIERLENQKKSWEMKLNHFEKERRTDLESSLRNTTPHEIVLRLEERRKKYHNIYAERTNKKKLDEETKKKNEADAKQYRMDYLMQLPLPHPRSTKVMDARTEKIRNDLQRDYEVQRDRHERQLAKEKSLREISAVMKSVVNENEAERKSATSFVELKPEKEMMLLSAAKRAEYRKELRAYKQRISERAKEKPSLMERQDMVVAAKTANYEALKKVSNAVVGTLSDREIAEYDVLKRSVNCKYPYCGGLSSVGKFVIN